MECDHPRTALIHPHCRIAQNTHAQRQHSRQHSPLSHLHHRTASSRPTTPSADGRLQTADAGLSPAHRAVQRRCCARPAMWRATTMQPAAAVVAGRVLIRTTVRGERAARISHSGRSLAPSPTHSRVASHPICIVLLHVPLSSVSGLTAAAGVLPLVAVRLQLHRSTVRHSRLLCIPPPQRGQLSRPITPRLESTPLQLLGSCDESTSFTLLAPQERGWIGAGAAAGVAAVGAWLFASTLHKRLAKRFADGAEHWDLQAYKRGGGLSHSPPLPATATCSADSSSLRVLVDGLPSYLLQHHRLRESALRRADTRSPGARSDGAAAAGG
jgi:hypothetical protein